MRIGLLRRALMRAPVVKADCLGEASRTDGRSLDWAWSGWVHCTGLHQVGSRK
jgi:hypothetical protein